jgi:signal transduction histidine kinase
VNEAIGSMSSALNLRDVLENIVHTARDLVRSRYAALGVADEQGRITQFITSGITPEQRAAIGPLPQGHGLLGALIGEGKPLRISNIAADPRSHGFPPNHPPMTSLLGVPILYHGEPVGDLYFTDKIGADEFSAEDQELVMLLANHAAVAIENARLYEEVRASRDRLQIWSEELEQKVVERTREIERYSKEMTTRVLQAQEEERKRIARELHDDTAQSLSTLMINVDLLEPQIPGDNAVLRKGVDRVRAIAQRTLDAVRALSHDLRPTILDDFGLAAALYWFAEEYTKTFGVPVDVDVADLPDEGLSSELELTLFRVTQEALTNIGKYADASRARVALSFPNSHARLVVSDDGRGFNPEAVGGPTRHGGLGLYGMRERVELIGGRLEIQSAPGEGTRVEVSAPVSVTETTRE